MKCRQTLRSEELFPVRTEGHWLISTDEAPSEIKAAAAFSSLSEISLYSWVLCRADDLQDDSRRGFILLQPFNRASFCFVDLDRRERYWRQMGWGDDSLLLRDAFHVCHAFINLVADHGALSVRVVNFVQVEMRGWIGGLFGSFAPPPTRFWPGTSATGWEADIIHKWDVMMGKEKSK